ncbi:hypothetical protein ATN83_5242 [Raoultella ornithinolytica]|nr:hypothetical protein ATN83_5242 [Raoultella ornithinolytica]KDX10007.1 hypothetical protein AB28_5107 [Raoultella ornithinolytica 2-156-04_S1_C2]
MNPYRPRKVMLDANYTQTRRDFALRAVITFIPERNVFEHAA